MGSSKYRGSMSGCACGSADARRTIPRATGFRTVEFIVNTGRCGTSSPLRINAVAPPVSWMRGLSPPSVALRNAPTSP